MLKKRILLQYWDFCLLLFLCLITLVIFLLVNVLIPTYSASEVSSDHLSMAITIVVTIIMGGCIIILVENQHIEGEIASRYHSIMRPFYHKLSLFAKLVQQFMFSLESKDSEGDKYKERLKNITFEFKRIANASIMSGKDTPYLKTEYLKNVCESANAIWYLFDRNHEIYSHLGLDNSRFWMAELKSAIVEYSHDLQNSDVNLSLFSKISGDFYCYTWQPIDVIPGRFDYFMGKCKDCKLILYISFIVELVSLVMIYLSDSAHHISLLSIDLLVILSVISFAFSLIKFMRLKAYNFILQF